MRVTVEFLGQARELANAREMYVELPDGATLRDVLAALAQSGPKLVGTVINEHKNELIAPYLFSIDGRHTVSDLEYKLKNGQRLILFLALAGG